MNAAAERLRVRVQRRWTEAEDICCLDLVAVAGELPPFSAGSHVDVHLPNGLVRQYSLCNAPHTQGPYQIGVLRDAEGRGGSRAVHELLVEGTALDISAPKNHFALAGDAPHHLLFGGGIGITPLMAMAEALHAQGASFTLHYCSRSPARTAFTSRLAIAPYAEVVHHHFDDGPAEQKLNIAGALGQAPAGTHLYVCGPQGFMDAVLGSARAAGWPEDRLHFEFFGAAPTQTANDGGFELEIASTGQVVKVAKDQSALAALLDAGIDIAMSCEQGVCGTCLTGVRAGVPEHRDHYLTPEEQAANNQFLPCCSRAKSARLVLEL